MTEAQYLSALSRGISEPVGREYEMFLFEHGLGPVENKWTLPPDPPMDPPTGIERESIWDRLKEFLERMKRDRQSNRNVPGELGAMSTLVDLREFSNNLPKNDRDRVRDAVQRENSRVQDTTNRDSSLDFVGLVGPQNLENNVQQDFGDNIEEKEQAPTKNNKDEEIVLGIRMDTRRKDPAMAAYLQKLLHLLLAGTMLVTSIISDPRIFDSILHYGIDSYKEYEQTVIFEHEEKVYVQDVTMGDYYDIYEGFTFHSNSLGGRQKTMGPEFYKEGKYTGKYRVTGFSITDGNNIISYNQDFDAQDDYTNLKEWVDDVLERENMNIEDVKIIIHFGHNKTETLENTRLGWMDIKDLYQNVTVKEEEVYKKIEQVSVESNTIKNFHGDTITLSNGVDIKIKDENGNYLAEGTHVIGSDGEEYVIKELHEEKELNETQTILRYGVKSMGIAASALIAFGALKGLGAKEKEKDSEEEKEDEEFRPSTKFKTYESKEEYASDLNEIDRVDKENAKSPIYTEIRKLSHEEVEEIKRVEKQKEELTANNKQLSAQEVERLYREFNKSLENIGKDNPIDRTVHGEVELEDEIVIKK